MSNYNLYKFNKDNLTKIFVIFLLALLSCNIANATNLAVDISENRINLSTYFQGKNIFLFGLKEPPRGNIYVVVSGPKKDYNISKKEKLGSLWLTSKNIIFKDVPVYYQLYRNMNNSIYDTNDKIILEKLGLNLNQANFNYEGKVNINYINEFRQALLSHFQKNNQYNISTNRVNIIGEGYLFKTTLKFPQKIYKGVYNIEVYLIDNGQLIASEIIPLQVQKIGFEAFIYNAMLKYPLLYGLMSVLFVLLIGWCINIIFWKI